MMESYRARNWSEARKAQKACSKLAGKFELEEFYRLYLIRINEFAKNPPPKDWDGVYIAETK